MLFHTTATPYALQYLDIHPALVVALQAWPLFQHFCLIGKAYAGI